MSVGNTTGVNTLFVYCAVVLATAAYIKYCRYVGSGGNTLIRKNAWYAVDVSMVLNAMIRGRACLEMARMQHCAPPMPNKKQVFLFLDQWYSAHGFKNAVLVLVYDGSRCPHKLRNAVSARKRAKLLEKRDKCTSYKALEKILKVRSMFGCVPGGSPVFGRWRVQFSPQSSLQELMCIDGDILFWVKQWVITRKLQQKVLHCGAPFEADAQLVQLERQGIVDGIVTDDGKRMHPCACTTTHTLAHMYTHLHTHSTVDAWFLGGNNILKGFTTRKKQRRLLGDTWR